RPPASSGLDELDRLAPGAVPDLAGLGAELAPRAFAAPHDHTEIELHGYLRLRSEALYNLDLDRGLDPSGHPLFPVPLGGGQTLDGGDLRLRTDVAIHPAGAGVAIKARFDVLDDVGFGSTPEVGTGRAPTPAASPGQRPFTAIALKRAWAEVLTPIGILAAGRMGAHWGLGIAANGGDCEDCDGGDSADRIALVTPLAGHFLALAYDLSSSGPWLPRKDGVRPLDLDPSDDATTLTAAWMKVHSPAARLRRAAAGRSTFEYGLYVSHRTQASDVPADYLPVASPRPPGSLDGSDLVARGFSATTAGAWLRIGAPRWRVEAEAVYARARIDQPSLVPGVVLDQDASSDQFGMALESDVLVRDGRGRLGLDAGVASGDDAPGFGAFPQPGAPAPKPGDLDGPQADPPGDTTVDNFRFHPDYHIDRILFREIIGTVTDAIYLRPHARVVLADLGHARLELGLAAIASWAVAVQSTPGNARTLGLELDPDLTYRSGAFRIALEHALFLPGAAFDNPAANLAAQPAQLVRVRLGFFY
ncbi:MAG TPA: TIGR04551 family protein, partial [Kofleriaceae bacterium]|nr:TIGR04551 family protein [Kofleriaceae bacterium]